MEWTIQQVAVRAGVTSRTLRHYDDIGLLPPTRVGDNGYRYYGVAAVARLQRILLLRDLGLSLPVIAEVLVRQEDEESVLDDHLEFLLSERDRLDQQIKAVRHSINARRSGTDPSLETMLDGFNDRYRDEIVSRWGERAYLKSNAWWHHKTLRQQVEWKRDTDGLIAEWVAASKDGVSPRSDRARSLAARHVAWLCEIPGTPLADGDRERGIDLVRGLGQMYVENPSYAATYGGTQGATFVRDSLHEYARNFQIGASPRDC